MTGAWSTPIPFGCGPSKVGPACPMSIGEVYGARTACVCAVGRQGPTGNGLRSFPVGSGARLGIIAGPAFGRAATRHPRRLPFPARLQELGRYGDAVDGARLKPVVRLSLDRARDSICPWRAGGISYILAALFESRVEFIRFGRLSLVGMYLLLTYCPSRSDMDWQ